MLGVILGMLGAGTAACLAYYLNVPVPEGMSDRGRMKVIMAGYKVAKLVARVGDNVGYDTSLNITRRVFGAVWKMTSQPVSGKGLKISNTIIDGVATRIYRPDDVTDGELLPVIVYFHGGGTIMFSVDTYDNILRQYAKDTRAVVIAPEYRLAPEHRFPAAVDDCLTVARHVTQHATDYRGDVSRIALAGDSMGSNLSVAVFLQLESDSPGHSRVKLLVLLCPMMQALDFQLPSYISTQVVTQGPVYAAAWYMYCTGKLPAKLPSIVQNMHISPEMKRSKYAQYVHLGEQARSSVGSSTLYDKDLAKEFEKCITDPYFSSLMAPDLSKLPRTLVMTAEYDALRDDGILLARRLKESGVKVTHDHRSSGWHDIMSYTRTEGGRQALRYIVKFFKTHL